MLTKLEDLDYLALGESDEVPVDPYRPTDEELNQAVREYHEKMEDDHDQALLAAEVEAFDKSVEHFVVRGEPFRGHRMLSDEELDAVSADFYANWPGM